MNPFVNGRLLTLASTLAITTLLGVAEPALAAFPEKPIKLIVGFRAGGASDAIATVLAKDMETILGQPVVKEIKAGGGGAKAAAAVKSAKPDGYTLVFAVTPTFAFNPAYAPKKTPYTKDDFDYLESLVKAQEAVYVKADAPYQSWKEMIAFAKKGNALNYSAVTPFDRVLTKYVSKKEGVTIKAVPTKGGSGAMKNVLGGHTELGFSGGNHVKQVAKKEITVIASLRSERLTGSPDVPTMKELGYPISFEAHFLVAGPKGMPGDVKEKLIAAIRKAAQGDGMKKLLTKLPFKEDRLGPDGLMKAINSAHKSSQAMIDSLK